MTTLESQIQKLVDGELTHNVRSQLLQRCEEQPELWRELGMAFVEHQIMTEVCVGTVRESSKSVEHESRSTPRSTPNGKSRMSKKMARVTWIVALAASLLLGIFVGGFRGIINESPLVQSSSPESPAENVEYPELADAIARSTSPIPSDFRREMLRAGFHVDEVERMTTVDLPIGGSVEIPTRFIEIKYLGSDLFQ